ncbi:MAG: hypothetical protein NZ761_01920 [Dehalococcoidia bacterium]|nr:hypothetical protein [Dehalococcoidia bacterium]
MRGAAFVRVGKRYLNAYAIAEVAPAAHGARVRFLSGDVVELTEEESAELLAVLARWSQATWLSGRARLEAAQVLAVWREDDDQEDDTDLG